MNKKSLFYAVGTTIVVISAVLFYLFNGDKIETEDTVLESGTEVVEEAIVIQSPSPTPADDNRFISFLHLAREQFNDDLLAESKSSYQEAIKNGASEKLLVANAWFELHYVFVALDDIEGARVALDTAIEMDPDNSTFLSAKEYFDKRENQN